MRYTTLRGSTAGYETTGDLRAALPPEGVWFGLTLNGWLMDHDDGTPVSPAAWHTLLEVLDPGEPVASPVQAAWLWVLGCAVCDDLRDIRESVEPPITAGTIEAGIRESDAWFAARTTHDT